MFTFGTPAAASSHESTTGATVGTFFNPFVPYTERSDHHSGRHLDEYQSISAQSVYSNFSQEELRLADYRQGRGGERAATSTQSPTQGFVAPIFYAQKSLVRTDRAHLDLLRGAAIRVCVGPVECTCPGPNTDSCECNDSWYLPKSLMSHHSAFLRAACTRDFKERQTNRIELPNDDPAVFALYVEWLYYGCYTVAAPRLFSAEPEHQIGRDVKCWILGDKLLDKGFKNFAMSRVYRQYTALGSFARAITTDEVRHVLENTAPRSKLRQLYLQLVVQHFANPLRLRGTTENWDELLLDHADARLLFFQNFRIAPEQRNLVKAEQEYMDHEKPLLEALSKMELQDQATIPPPA
ncbi:hypothetical protein CC86DRAFT_372916 [Ophiobolus disseminans]|uniref:BTB domain-containing protein n=1 Tax=Ophiobolus disseminans TaxID=1469910 RepID=A0A6A6ZNZ7_9PLEO|nr:hypothetical protein CC86DRAFT_372916 [Ophiobolus disseminans]